MPMSRRDTDHYGGGEAYGHSSASGILGWSGANETYPLATESSAVETALSQELPEGTVVLAVEVDPLDFRKCTLRPNERQPPLASRCTDAHMRR